MERLLSLSTVFISFFGVSGVMIHGAHLDQLTGAIRIVQRADSGQHSGVDNNTHPHAEFQNSTLFRYLSNSSANYPAERSKHKKHMLQNQAPRGRHAFDNHFLPIIG